MSKADAEHHSYIIFRLEKIPRRSITQHLDGKLEKTKRKVAGWPAASQGVEGKSRKPIWAPMLLTLYTPFLRESQYVLPYSRVQGAGNGKWKSPTPQRNLSKSNWASLDTPRTAQRVVHTQQLGGSSSADPSVKTHHGTSASDFTLFRACKCFLISWFKFNLARVLIGLLWPGATPLGSSFRGKLDFVIFMSYALNASFANFPRGTQYSVNPIME